MRSASNVAFCLVFDENRRVGPLRSTLHGNEIDMNIFEGRKALLLDMNGTFMFGHDRFGANEDYYPAYRTLDPCGGLDADTVNRCIRTTIDRLERKYRDSRFIESFPQVAEELGRLPELRGRDDEIARLVTTFGHHELGHVPADCLQAVHELAARFRLTAVIDIWAPSQAWRALFRDTGLADVFESIWFSSDHGIVKPSGMPFEWTLARLQLSPGEVLMVGDSVRRDLGGARKAGIDCVLVGGNVHEDSIAEFPDLPEFAGAVL